MTKTARHQWRRLSRQNEFKEGLNTLSELSPQVWDLEFCFFKTDCPILIWLPSPLFYQKLMRGGGGAGYFCYGSIKNPKTHEIFK